MQAEEEKGRHGVRRGFACFRVEGEGWQPGTVSRAKALWGLVGLQAFRMEKSLCMAMQLSILSG